MKKVIVVLTLLLFCAAVLLAYFELSKPTYKATVILMKNLALKEDIRRPAVVFIPGVMGTDLFKENSRRIWPPDVMSVALDFAQNYLDTSGNSANLHVKPGLPLQNVYGEIYEYLEKQGYNVYYFGYDWRLDNTINAKLFGQFIDSLPAEKVSVVAHSMGGLVTTEYLRHTSSKKVEKFIAIGTPFLGAPGALKDLEMGTFLGNGLVGQISRPFFKKLLRNESSWYQLLPGKKSFDLGATTYIEKILVKGNESTTVTLGNFNETEAFLRSRPFINKALLDSGIRFTDNLDLPGTLKKTDTYFIAGINRPTITKLNYFFHAKGTREIFDKVLYETSSRGDGSVSVSSATLGGSAENMFPGHVFYFDELHGLLPANGAVLEKIDSILKGIPATGN